MERAGDLIKAFWAPTNLAQIRFLDQTCESSNMRDSLVDDPTVSFKRGSATWAEKGMFVSTMWFQP